jgi:hypothetical protein
MKRGRNQKVLCARSYVYESVVGHVHCHETSRNRALDDAGPEEWRVHLQRSLQLPCGLCKAVQFEKMHQKPTNKTVTHANTIFVRYTPTIRLVEHQKCVNFGHEHASRWHHQPTLLPGHLH